MRNEKRQFKKGRPPTTGSFKKGNRYWDHPNNEKTRVKKGDGICFEENHEPFRMIGEKNGNWKGGISNSPYPVDWTRTLKRSIRERDGYICKSCGMEQTEVTHHVHHIDYNKENCDPKNLITLCNSCHSKTNLDREYWKEYFKQSVVPISGGQQMVGTVQPLALATK